MAISSTWVTVFPGVEFKRLMLGSMVHQHLRLVHVESSTGCTQFLGQILYVTMTVNMASPPHFLGCMDGLTNDSGLIRWKFVFHGFIDGFSRLVTGIRASNNNRAETVFSLFQDMISIHGVPSRMRGDHGVENGIVARWMEAFRGILRGSYIWGW